MKKHAPEPRGDAGGVVLARGGFYFIFMGVRVQIYTKKEKEKEKEKKKKEEKVRCCAE